MIKRLIIALFATAIFVAAGTGCRTAHGAGEDIERAGEKIQEHTPP
jgi:predicted small secreted protein